MSINYRPTGAGTPQPLLLDKLTAKWCGRWVPVTEALPPQKLPVLVVVRGDNCAAFGWLKFGAGDRTCPYFVAPQMAAMEPRGTPSVLDRIRAIKAKAAAKQAAVDACQGHIWRTDFVSELGSGGSCICVRCGERRGWDQIGADEPRAL